MVPSLGDASHVRDGHWLVGDARERSRLWRYMGFLRFFSNPVVLPPFPCSISLRSGSGCRDAFASCTSLFAPL